MGVSGERLSGGGAEWLEFNDLHVVTIELCTYRREHADTVTDPCPCYYQATRSTDPSVALCRRLSLPKAVTHGGLVRVRIDDQLRLDHNPQRVDRLLGGLVEAAEAEIEPHLEADDRLVLFPPLRVLSAIVWVVAVVSSKHLRRARSFRGVTMTCVQKWNLVKIEPTNAILVCLRGLVSAGSGSVRPSGRSALGWIWVVVPVRGSWSQTLYETIFSVSPGTG